MLTTFFTRFFRRSNELRAGAALAFLFILSAPALANAMDLKPKTLHAWEDYVRATKAGMAERAKGKDPFLWVDEQADRAERVRAGEVVVEPVGGFDPHPVPGGLIHDWIGAVFIPQAKLDAVLAVLNDYDHYKDFYKPVVAKSQLLERTDDHAKVSTVMVQRAYSVTAAVQIVNDVDTMKLDADRQYSFSISAQLQEIADYGQPDEHAYPQDQGPGYVWREFTLTRIEQRDGGVYVEMELAALSRGIPWELRWLIQPLARRLARNILRATLEETRNAVNQEIKPR